MPKQKRDKSLEYDSSRKRVIKEVVGEIELEPKCMITPKNKEGKYAQLAAVTNRGYLIPCCWIDEKETLNHPIMQKMLKVSKISEHKSIDEIVLSKEWIEFATNLANHDIDKILPTCIHHCRKRKETDKIKKETYFNNEGKVEKKNIV